MLDTDGVEGQFTSTIISLKSSEVGKINQQTSLTTKGRALLDIIVEMRYSSRHDIIIT